MPRFININSIIDKAMIYPQVREMEFADLTLWTIEVLRALKFPLLFVDDNHITEVLDYTAELPCDEHHLKKIDALFKAKDTRFASLQEYKALMESGSDPGYPVVSKNYIVRKALMYSQNSFNRTDKQITGAIDQYVYSINQNTLYFGFKEGIVDIAYKKLAFDLDTGLPMILDNNELIRAIVDYIIASSSRVLFYSGKITGEIYNDAMQKYYFSIASADSSLRNEHLLNTDVQESFGNILYQIVLNAYTHASDYNNLGAKQKYIY